MPARHYFFCLISISLCLLFLLLPPRAIIDCFRHAFFDTLFYYADAAASALLLPLASATLFDADSRHYAALLERHADTFRHCFSSAPHYADACHFYAAAELPLILRFHYHACYFIFADIFFACRYTCQPLFRFLLHITRFISPHYHF